ncbi:hypothetical protein FEZ21_20270 [Pseudomonas sp. 9.1(2019)]|nr:hypothetical protein [Pseudomonas sp. 9.1(2019)]
MAKVVYTLKKRTDTEEVHIFTATPVPEDKCRPANKSICRKMDLSETESTLQACMSERTARVKAAEIGRSVCGPCVSHLYETY